MRRDSRFSVALHALLHLAERDEAVPSEALAGMMRMNPVVLRRTIAGLRDAGMVRTEKGHGGGLTLGRSLASMTLGDVYDALGKPDFFRMNRRVQSPGCLVEQSVNRSLQAAFADAETLLLNRLHSVSLADLAAEVRLHRSQDAQKGMDNHV